MFLVQCSRDSVSASLQKENADGILPYQPIAMPVFTL
jgi:hypothetical protein